MPFTLRLGSDPTEEASKLGHPYKFCRSIYGWSPYGLKDLAEVPPGQLFDFTVLTQAQFEHHTSLTSKTKFEAEMKKLGFHKYPSIIYNPNSGNNLHLYIRRNGATHHDMRYAKLPEWKYGIHFERMYGCCGVNFVMFKPTILWTKPTFEFVFDQAKQNRVGCLIIVLTNNLFNSYRSVFEQNGFKEFKPWTLDTNEHVMIATRGQPEKS